MRARSPRYYDSLIEEELLAKMKAKRKVKAERYSDDQTPRRLREREKVGSQSLTCLNVVRSFCDVVYF